MPERYRRLAHSVAADAVRVQPAPGSHRVAIRAGLVMLVALLTLWGIDRVDLGLAATFGAFASVYGGRWPTPGRWRTQSRLGLLLVTGVALGSLIAIAPARAWLAIPAVMVAASLATLLSDRQGWRPPGPLFLVFAVGGSAAIPGDVERLVLSIVVALGAATFAVLLGRAEEHWLPGGTPAPPIPPANEPILDTVRAAVAVGLAGVLVTVTGSQHPYWAMVAAAVLLATPTVHARLARGVQRAAGTLVGLGFAAIVLLLPIPVVVALIVAATLQALVELLIGRNYALGLVFVTPLALLLGHLAAPQPIPELLIDRLVETVLGVTVGAASVLLIRPRTVTR